MLWFLFNSFPFFFFTLSSAFCFSTRLTRWRRWFWMWRRAVFYIYVLISIIFCSCWPTSGTWKCRMEKKKRMNKTENCKIIKYRKGPETWTHAYPFIDAHKVSLNMHIAMRQPLEHQKQSNHCESIMISLSISPLLSSICHFTFQLLSVVWLISGGAGFTFLNRF